MRLPPLLIAVPLVVLVACVPTAGPTATASRSSAAPVASPSESLAAPESSSPSTEPSDEPVATESYPPSDEPSASASESAGPGAAAACTGSDKNREFFEAAAAALDWTVYCALLPTGWFVDSGEYRQAGGGRLEIAYRGPGGAHLELHEGAFCADTAGCIPPGTESGDATFGGLAATLIATDDGGWAVATEPKDGLSWLAVGSGVNEQAFRTISDALAIVDG
jgi:hypothetical protein